MELTDKVSLLLDTHVKGSPKLMSYLTLPVKIVFSLSGIAFLIGILVWVTSFTGILNPMMFIGLLLALAGGAMVKVGQSSGNETLQQNATNYLDKLYGGLKDQEVRAFFDRMIKARVKMLLTIRKQTKEVSRSTFEDAADKMDTLMQGIFDYAQVMEPHYLQIDEWRSEADQIQTQLNTETDPGIRKQLENALTQLNSLIDNAEQAKTRIESVTLDVETVVRGTVSAQMMGQYTSLLQNRQEEVQEAASSMTDLVSAYEEDRLSRERSY